MINKLLSKVGKTRLGKLPTRDFHDSLYVVWWFKLDLNSKITSMIVYPFQRVEE